MGGSVEVGSPRRHERRRWEGQAGVVGGSVLFDATCSCFRLLKLLASAN
jgi:hypothetical protein